MGLSEPPWESDLYFQWQEPLAGHKVAPMLMETREDAQASTWSLLLPA